MSTKRKYTVVYERDVTTQKVKSTQNGGNYTVVYGRVRNVTSHATGVFQLLLTRVQGDTHGFLLVVAAVAVAEGSQQGGGLNRRGASHTYLLSPPGSVLSALSQAGTDSVCSSTLPPTVSWFKALKAHTPAAS